VAPTPLSPALSPALSSREIADLAVAALHDEVDLTPKPGLVDGRGPGSHTDMSPDMLHASADALHPAFYECATAGGELELCIGLRARVGIIGRAGEGTMLTATGGVNTHRGALWALGLLCTAAGAGASTVDDVVLFAARLARIADPARPGTRFWSASHGARARRRYHVAGAPGEAQAAFPHITRHALPALRAGLAIEADPIPARLDALLALIAHLDDTCVLHRGGPQGLAAVQASAYAALAAGGIRTCEGRQHFSVLDRLCAQRRLSPGGAGDLLAATLYLDVLERRSAPKCRR
jgi:triphosphoribosyl-dephospho-CoA synthase